MCVNTCKDMCNEMVVGRYANEFEAAVQNHVVDAPDADGANLFQRMVATWRHIYYSYPNYEWYLRLWDDNFLIIEEP